MSDVQDLYQDIILRHSRAPLRRRCIDPFDARASGDNPMCGDRCEIRVRFGGDGVLDEIGFEGRGCAISLASADLMALAAEGRTPEEARALAADFRYLVSTGDSGSDDPAMDSLRVFSGIAEYPSRIKCATLPWAALIAALNGAQEASSE